MFLLFPYRLCALSLMPLMPAQVQKSLKLRFSASQSINGNVIIKVSDNGKGIPEEIMDNIFVPFFSTKKNGSGIGLSLCKQIMLLHKGKIQIQSIEGKGTTIGLVF